MQVLYLLLKLYQSLNEVKKITLIQAMFMVTMDYGDYESRSSECGHDM